MLLQLLRDLADSSGRAAAHAHMILENTQIVARRWPEVFAWLGQAPVPSATLIQDAPHATLVIDDIQLGSAYAPIAEAQRQAALIPTDATDVVVYGIGQGGLPRSVLRRDAVRRLRVVLLSRDTARAALEFLHLEDWLDDPRVELIRPGSELQVETPFAALPAELRLADRDAWRLRDQVVLELATPFIHQHAQQVLARNAANIEACRPFIESDGDVCELFGSREKATLRIAAAGPTLVDHFEELAEASSSVIAVDSALGPLLSAGVVPSVVVSLDGYAEGVRRLFDVDLSSLHDATLVYSPVTPCAVLEAWPGARLAAYAPGNGYRALRDELPRATLWSSGSVTHAAVDLAVRMGAGRIELFGADFATPGNRSHVEGMAWERAIPSDASTPRVLDATGCEVPSMPNLIGYLRDLERYIHARPNVDFVNRSRSGARIAGARYLEDSHAV